MKDKKKQPAIKKLSVKELMKHPCSGCGGEIRRKAVSQEFAREGVHITISGFKAWVCTNCGEIYFAPDAADKLVQAANALYALAEPNKTRKVKIAGLIS